MNIGIVGSGNIGRALGLAWAKRGHRILWSFSHDQRKLEALATQSGNGSRATKPYEAVSLSEVVLFAAPWTQLDEAIKQIGRFDGETVIDATNPYVDEQMHVQDFEDGSSSECVAKKMPGAKVVKAFNTLRAQTLETRAGQGLVVFMAGDYPLMKAKVGKLIEDAGFVAFDVGPLVEGKCQQPQTDRYLKELTLEQASQLTGISAQQTPAKNSIMGEIDLDQPVRRY